MQTPGGPWERGMAWPDEGEYYANTGQMARTVGGSILVSLGGAGVMKVMVLGVVLVLLCVGVVGAEEVDGPTLSAEKDLLSLHYDHAPDKDDGQSAAADRTILGTLFDIEWMKKHVVAVSGAYGENAKRFNVKSDAVMDAVWNDCGGWLAGHTKRAEVVAELVQRWTAALKAGGDVWVKEGGQSDITAVVVRRIGEASPDIDTTARIHVVQHADWNESKTTDAALAYVKKHTDYIRIRDANNYLNIKGGHESFEKAAVAHPVYGPMWKAAFVYYDPNDRLDFSDTGELMRILGLGEIGVDEFRERFLGE